MIPSRRKKSWQQEGGSLFRTDLFRCEWPPRSSSNRKARPSQQCSLSTLGSPEWRFFSTDESKPLRPERR